MLAATNPDNPDRGMIVGGQLSVAVMAGRNPVARFHPADVNDHSAVPHAVDHIDTEL
jgi:hypothetical protein